MRDVKTMRPLTVMYEPGEHFEITPDGLNAWQRSAAYQRVFGSYRNYPERSLQSDEARALLHHLIVMRKPERALEIGTYEAGTTEVLARALWAVRGHLDTIDPFGGERCPPLISTFPAESAHYLLGDELGVLFRHRNGARLALRLRTDRRQPRV